MIQYFDKLEPIWTRKYTLSRLSLATNIFFLSLWKLLAKEWCCSNTGITLKPVLKAKIPSNLYIANTKEQIGKKKLMLKFLERNYWAEQKTILKLLIKHLHNVPLKDWKYFHLGTADFYTSWFINIEKTMHIPILCLAETLATCSSISDFVIKINSLNLLLSFHFRVGTFRK